MFRIALFISIMTLLPLDAFGQGKFLNILYTGGIQGELEPCGCSPETQSGGLARLSGFVASKREALTPYIMIDAGNSTKEDTPQGRLKNEVLLRSFGVIGYDVIAFQGQELSLPEDFLGPLVMKHDLPVVSESSSWRRSMSVERGSLRVHISTDLKGYKRGMLNILLTDRPVSELTSIKGWEVVISSSGEILEKPQEQNGTIVVSGYPKGEKLGILALSFDDQGKVAALDHQWQFLGSDIEDDMKIRMIIREYDAKVAELVRDEEKALMSEGPYLGLNGCATCHQPFIDSWQNTKHANAFYVLDRVGKSMDPECVACHTTGYWDEGGFDNKDTTPDLANVQCEACHGPGRGHAADFSSPMRPVNELVCLRCHTKSNSPEFNYQHYLERIKH